MELPFTVADVLALGFLALTTVMATRRGLSGELAQAVSFVPAFFLGLFCFDPCSRWLSRTLKLEVEFAQAFSFIMVFALTLIVLLSIRLLLKNLLKLAFPAVIERVGGLIAGLARGCVIVLIVFITLNLIPHAPTNEAFGERSLIGREVIARMPPLRSEIEQRMEARRRALREHEKTGVPIWKLLRDERRSRMDPQ